MKYLSKIMNVLLLIAILLTLTSSVGAAITKKPILLSVIRSNSMYPVWQRGDMVIIENLDVEKEVSMGDIIFFQTPEGSLSDKGWIAHRIIEGNKEEGYITQGDANEATDQVSDGTSPIQREWIAARAFTVFDKPIVLPKLGYLSLWMEEYRENPYIVPIIVLLLAVIIGIGELTPEKKRKKKKSSMELPLIYMAGGLTISIIMFATMLSSSQQIKFDYEISKEAEGVILGSPVGMIKMGDQITNDLTTLSNNGLFPLISTITTKDSQVSLSHNLIQLRKGSEIEATFTVHADTPGYYQSSIQVGLFYPFLPPDFLYFLANKSYWLALCVVALLPGIPLILYPFIDPSMRKKIVRAVRKKGRKLFST